MYLTSAETETTTLPSGSLSIKAFLLRSYSFAEMPGVSSLGLTAGSASKGVRYIYYVHGEY